VPINFFYILLATAISGTPTPETFPSGPVETNDLAQGALRRFTQCRWIGHTTLKLWGAYSTTELSPP